MSSTPAVAAVLRVKMPAVDSNVRVPLVANGVVTEVEKTGLAMVAIVVLVVPDKEILVPAVNSEAIFWKVGAPVPCEVKS
jgi:hypothetical protein